ncbi:DUF3139 domain-containing protein [Paenibacillus chitinolyticus]|uniref:DUF3139 domain-containing protein n=1 Tax=Paenibacillus chitinolyticus TaxID=79263 RepID=UPI0036DE4238
MKKFIVGLLVVLLVVGGTVFVTMSVKANNLKKEVQIHLKNKGYKESEIKNVEGKISKTPQYVARVTFNDEPDIVYLYTKNENGVVQFNATLIQDNSYQYKHKESNW